MDGSGRRTEDGRFATRNPLSAICPSSCHNYRRAEWTSLEDEPSTSALPYVLPTALSTARPSVRPSLSPSLCPFLCVSVFQSFYPYVGWISLEEEPFRTSLRSYIPLSFCHSIHWLF